MPALVDWLRHCLATAPPEPLPPAPTFPLPTVPSTDTLGTTEDGGHTQHEWIAPLDVWGCWTALRGTPTHRVLAAELERHHRCRPSTTTLLPADSAYLLAPLVPERVAFLRAAGPWLPYHEIATVLGWTGPLRKAYHIVPLLAKGFLQPHGIRDECWRARGPGGPQKPFQYCWERCLGALRRAAVLHDALLVAEPGLAWEQVSIQLNRLAGF